MLYLVLTVLANTCQIRRFFCSLSSDAKHNCHPNLKEQSLIPRSRFFLRLIRRAAVSIPANIAEGQGRLTTGEFKQFLGHARGSMFELESHALIACNLGYLSDQDTQKIAGQIHELGKLVNGLLKALDRKGRLGIVD